MATEIRNVAGAGDYKAAVGEAVAVLRRGGLVVFPTETVYGLAANAAIPEAVARLREVKNRPAEKPFTVHLGRSEDLQAYVPAPTVEGLRLARKGWPGPLTLIFALRDIEDAPVVKEIGKDKAKSLYRKDTIGLRCPDSKPAIDLLQGVGAPVIAASANPAGMPPAVSGEGAARYLDGHADLILDGGRSRYAKPSTVVRITDDGCEILREGVLDDRLVRRMLTMNMLFVCSGNTCRSPMAEGICRKLLAERLGCSPKELETQGYMVASAGTHGMTGSPASPEGVAACESIGIDISDHRAQALTPELVNVADYIFCMTRRHLETVNYVMPSARAKVLLLDSEGDVEDPIGGSEELYKALADRMEKLIRKHLEDIEL